MSSCIAMWMRRYADIFPMYNKTLEEYPERPIMFLEEFETMPVDVLSEAFRRCVKTCSEFPVPAEVRTQCGIVLDERRNAKEAEETRERSRRLDKPQEETEEQRQALVREVFNRVRMASDAKAMPSATKVPVSGSGYERKAVEAFRSRVPSDPEERAKWAHQKAVKNGWIEEEKGELQ